MSVYSHILRKTLGFRISILVQKWKYILFETKHKNGNELFMYCLLGVLYSARAHILYLCYLFFNATIFLVTLLSKTYILMTKVNTQSFNENISMLYNLVDRYEVLNRVKLDRSICILLQLLTLPDCQWISFNLMQNT